MLRTDVDKYKSAYREFLNRQEILKIQDLIQEVNGLNAKYEQFNGCYGLTVFFGATPRFRKGGKKEDVKLCTCLWADIDFDSVPEVEAWERIRAFSPKPSAIVASGHGLHLYWSLDPPSADLPRCEAAMKEIARQLGGDSVSNINRLMRLPQTYNWKDPEDPKFCDILEINL
jgi:hypothetical protein